MTKIAQVFAMSNGTVMLYDELGRQIIELQGPLASRKTHVLKASSPTTRFYFAKWRQGEVEITREEFTRLEVQMPHE